MSSLLGRVEKLKVSDLQDKRERRNRESPAPGSTQAYCTTTAPAGEEEETALIASDGGDSFSPRVPLDATREP